MSRRPVSTCQDASEPQPRDVPLQRPFVCMLTRRQPLSALGQGHTHTHERTEALLSSRNPLVPSCLALGLQVGGGGWEGNMQLANGASFRRGPYWA